MIEPEHIVKVRSEHGWSQSALGEFVGVDQGTVSKWETSKARPNGAAARLLDLLISGRIVPDSVPASGCSEAAE